MGLLATAGLVPAAAMAQDGREGMRGQGRGGAEMRAGAQQGRGERGWQRQQGTERSQRADGLQRTYTPRVQADNRGPRQDARQDLRQVGAVPADPARAQRVRGGDRAQIDRRVDQRGQVDRGQTPNRWGSARADRRDFNRDRAGFYDRQEWARRGWDDRGAGRSGYNGAGGWNRGWRQDSRYNWAGYRAANRSAYRLPRYYAPYGWDGGYRRFSIGGQLSSLLFAQSYWIDDPYSYRLPEAYGPYRWVRYYNDALLVDLETGEVVDSTYDIFW